MKNEYPQKWAIPDELDGLLFFQRICKYLKSFTAIDLVKKWTLEFDANKVEDRLNILDATSVLMSEGYVLPFAETRDDGLHALEHRQSQISQDQLIQWGRDLDKYIGFMNQAPEDNLLRNYLIQPSEDIKRLSAQIFQVFGDGHDVLDRASNELAKIRSNIIKQIRLNNQLAEDLIRDPKYQSMLQEPIHVEHMGRQVLLWKTDFSGRIDGMRHGRSKSGQTTYFEPTPLMHANNQLMRLQEAEFSEVNRIVRDLFLSSLALAPQIIELVKCLRWLDFCQAKVQYVNSFNYSCRPQLDGEIFEVSEMIHPAIDDPVAQNFTLQPPSRIVILSGPNAGGKTVCMKTLGIIVLHAALGLKVPAKYCLLPKISKVLVNLGDQQSLSDSLSSFSARLRQWRKIFKRIDSESLILVDEIMNATDPREGQILAQEICQFLQRRKVFAIVTTHFGELKQLAQKDNYFENASMVFDKESLKPTFELLMGTPGHSYAIDLAQRFNLPVSIIERARKSLGKQHFELSNILESQKSKQIKLEILLQDSKRLKQSLNQLIETGYVFLEKFENDRERILQRSLRNSRRKIHKIIRELTESTSRSSESDSGSAKKQRLDRKSRDQELAIKQEELKKAQQLIIESHGRFSYIHNIAQGDTVRLIGYNKTAVVQKVYHDKAEALVRLGQVEIQVAIEELEFLSADESSKGSGGHKNVRVEVEPSSSRSIDLRGHNSDDALIELEQFLDRALMNHPTSLEIITGKGILKKIVTEYLLNCLDTRDANKLSVHQLAGSLIINCD